MNEKPGKDNQGMPTPEQKQKDSAAARRPSLGRVKHHINQLQDESEESYSHEYGYRALLKDKEQIPEEMLKQRAEYLKEQRDKLMVMKKKQREKQLIESSKATAGERPRTAQVARERFCTMPARMSDWKSGGAKMLEERMPSTGEDRYRTCCNCWHIRIGTLFLGILELVAVSILLSGLLLAYSLPLATFFSMPGLTFMVICTLKEGASRIYIHFSISVSNRVRIAKENGLWRNTSWGGGFQQYRGQYEKKPTKTEEKKPKASSNRVQWNLSRNEEKSIHSTPDPTEKSLELSVPTAEETAASPIEPKDGPRSTKKKENSDSPPAGQKHHKSNSKGKTPLALTHSLDTSKTGRPILQHNSYSVEGPEPLLLLEDVEAHRPLP
uniref:Uncharacterized protein n=1 Tax=Ditylenchus dipsaci TaxID=166011 RepID=A0A915D8V1_9BILA